jgi:hypothetical protein
VKEREGCKVGLRAFEKLKLFYVKQVKERNTYAYKYHVEMAELKLGFNNMRMALRGVHGKHYECNCDMCTNANSVLCMVEKCTFYGLIDFWTSVLCPLDDVTWHQQLCLKGDCEDYGVDMLFICPLKEDANLTSLMQWNCYQKVLHGKTHVGKDNFVLHLQYKELIAKVFLDYLQPRLKKFIYHNYVYHFQDEQYHTRIWSFPKKIILFAIDFEENYTFQDYHEIQEMHWHSFQITILMYICYKWNPNYVLDVENGEERLLTEYHYISLRIITMIFFLFNIVLNCIRLI